MPSLNKENRKLLENTVAAARVIAVKGATTVLRDQYAVGESAPWPHMSDLENKLRVKLRAHGRQLGDRRDPQRDTQEFDRLAQACAYEHWHRMLFARFLAENDLLLDPDHGVAMTLADIRELAQEQHRDWQELAAELAQRMLLAVFRPEDPVLSIVLPPETRLQLEEKLALLPAEVFLADDSLGWVYQFWQRDEKDRVNKSEVKIGADELPAVTQLFTEDYMVLFLLENTLGAWWTAKRRAEGKNTALPGFTFTYLRLNENGSPAAGGFDGWPRTAKELSVLDPCMGSGHFLVFALPILARMRMEEEALTLQESLYAVLRDNLFGLEIDARCAQIAAFNLALAAWRLAGEHFALPELQLACCGIGPNCTKEQWIKLAEEVAASGGMPAKSSLFESEDSLLSEPVKRTMEGLFTLFSQASILGSLIDPKRLRANLFQANFGAVSGLFAGVLSAQGGSEDTRERLIAAAGMVKAATLLSREFTLVTTNVPYLSIRRQRDGLRTLLQSMYTDGKACLSTAFLQRLLSACEAGGTLAAVTPQHWLFQPSYRALRTELLARWRWSLLAHLGTGAFETISGEVVNVILVSIEKSTRNDQPFFLIDASNWATPAEKSLAIRDVALAGTTQQTQLENPEARVMLQASSRGKCLDQYAEAPQGIITGDLDHWQRCFWELPGIDAPWQPFLSTTSTSAVYTAREHIVDWSGAAQDFIRPRPGNRAIGRKGVAVSQMSDLAVTLYLGEAYDGNVAPIVPIDQTLVPALWAFVNSQQYRPMLRNLDRAGKLTNGTLLKIVFEESQWRGVANTQFATGLPVPSSDDPTQWLFHGSLQQSNLALQVAVARLLGYRWPRQAGTSFMDCPPVGPDSLDKLTAQDGIVPLGSISGTDSAADRLRNLLANVYGAEWSATKLAGLLGDNESLESWLRDRFFEEHCEFFHQRPFLWHVWDGRKDGFHALVNYHKLAASNGEGRKTLERLIYTTLGDWITRQRADVSAGIDGADGRLAAAEHLKGQLEKILQGEKPYDIFVRWKRLDQQPIGWEPDINDGVRLNIRPWLAATLSPGTKPKKGACILRVTPKIKDGKDRGKEPERKKEDFPWFWSWDEKTEDFAGGAEFDGVRWNDPHYSLSVKQKARDQKKQREGA